MAFGVGKYVGCHCHEPIHFDVFFFIAFLSETLKFGEMSSENISISMSEWLLIRIFTNYIYLTGMSEMLNW